LIDGVTIARVTRSGTFVGPGSITRYSKLYSPNVGIFEGYL